MNVINSHKVEEEIKGIIRLSDHLKELFPQLPSKSSVKKAVKKGLILVDGIPGTTGTIIRKGQKIELLERSNPILKIFKLNFDVIFEDDHIAVINKPSGFNVSGNEFRTIENALLFNLKPSKEEDTLRIFKPVHRLDNQTSGLLLIAKTQSARINLGRQFESKHVKKTYTAVVTGKITSEGEINIPINNKEALSKFKSLRTEMSLRFEDLSLVKLTPVTGRTHQLRIHCFKSGFPILGDKLYYKEGFLLKGKGLFLCSSFIQFRHPYTNNPVSFNIDYPKKFNKIIEREKQRYIFKKC